MNSPSLEQRERIMEILELQRQGEIHKAFERLRPIMLQYSDNAELHHLSAQLFNALGQKENMHKMLLKTVELNPHNAYAYNDLGCYFAERSEDGEALSNFKKAVLLLPQHRQAIANVIKLLLKIGIEKKTINSARAAMLVRDLFPRGLPGIGQELLPAESRRALVIYVDEAIPWYVANWLDYFPFMNSHTMYWESVEMVRILNRHGYIVDWIGVKFEEALSEGFDWSQYHLVIDGGNNLKKIPSVEGQVLVCYSTGKHWSVANETAMRRTKMFNRRNKTSFLPDRLHEENGSDACAHYMTYFGNLSQLQGFDEQCKKIPLNISAVHIPDYRERDIGVSKKHFIWLGGQGMIHKGLDLVVEAFSKLPHLTLHIVANFSVEPESASWFCDYVKTFPNVVYHGGQNVASSKFEDLAWGCLGTVYVSASEGGPGSVAQLLHYGIIPIVTKTSNVRGEGLGYVIEEERDEEIIQSIVNCVQRMMETGDEELRSMSRQIREYALANHTREAYSRSFDALLEEIDSIQADRELKNAVVSRA